MDVIALSDGQRDADGEGVWSWRPLAGAKHAVKAAGDGDYEVTDTGESSQKVVNHRAGKAGAFR